MNWKSVLIQIFLCLGIFSTCLYSYLDMQNALTSLRMELPELAGEVRRIQEENAQLRYEIEMRQNPLRLMEIARESEFAHLKYPNCDEVLTLREALPLPEKVSVKSSDSKVKNKLAFVRK